MSILNIESTDRRCAEADAFKMSENLFGARMTHSISTSSGVDGATSNLGHRGGKKLTVRIQMLDDSVTIFQVQAKALGKVLFEQVCRQLNLLEADYFGLEYQEISSHTKYWLDLEKPLNRQVGFSLMDPLLRFCVKFYTPDPAQLEEEYTRYMFCLQIKRDLSSGNLPCNDNTAAIMSSYIVQASCGDFVPEDYPDHKYLSSYRFVPHQDDLMQRKIMENHKKHIGQSPAEADMNLLETARRCELYGMKMHSAKDIEGVPLNLAVAHMGITVFQNITRINTFSWAKIRKLSFKRKRFLIKLHPEGYGYYKDTVEFYFEGRNECKNFWKKCVENHGFFRCITIQKQPRRKSRVLSRGSSFRYSGKTQKQMIEFVRENYVKRQTFQRSQSFRQGTFSSSSRCQSKSYVNSSISANPLLPVNTADWDCQNRNSDFTTNAMRMETVTLDHQQNIFTDSTLVQVTAAQAEILPPTNLLSETQNKEAAKTKHSALFQNQQLKNSVNNNSSSNDNNTNLAAIALEQDHFRQNVHSIGLHPLNNWKSNSTPRPLTEVQAYATASLPKQPLKASSNNAVITHSVDLNSSIESEQGEEEEINSDLMTPTSVKRENIIMSMSTESSPIHSLDQKLHSQESFSETVTPIHYSSTKFSKSKRCIINNSTETETDNIIYTDIPIEQIMEVDLQACQVEKKISNRENINLNDTNDIYATINHETKLKSREKLFSDEYINKKLLQNVKIKRRNQFELHKKQQEKIRSSASEKSSLYSRGHNDLDDPSGIAIFTLITRSQQESSTLCDRFSNFDNLITQSVDSQNTASGKADIQNHFLPKKCEYYGIDSLDSYDSHYITHHPFININSRLHYVNRENVLPLGSFVGNRNSPSASPTKTYSDMLGYKISDYFQSVSKPEKKTKEEEERGKVENIYDQVQKEPWLRSSSCINFNTLATYFDCEHLYKDKILNTNCLSLNRIDSPITLFDDTGASNYTVRINTNTSRKDISQLRNAKTYSHSFPGNTYSAHDRRLSNHIDTCSQDDLSQDSYELLEKFGHDVMVTERSRSQDFHHSFSLDSGNYIPTEDEGSESEQHRYRSAMDVKCKSAADIMNDIWDTEDPRYLPREKMCVKSDGSFYKKIKEVFSHSSSQDSKKSHDSLYYTDSKKSRETSKSKSSIVSSQDLKENAFVECIGRYEMPTTTVKKIKQYKKEQFESGLDIKTEFYRENPEEKVSKIYLEHPKVKRHDCLLTDSKNTTESSLKYNSKEIYLTFPSNKIHKTSKVHSISLQNVEIEKNCKWFGVKSPISAPSCILNPEKKKCQTNESIDNTVNVKGTHQSHTRMFQLQHSSESTNIFSFDQDHIADIQKCGSKDNQNTDFPLTPELISEFDKQQPNMSSLRANWRDELMAKTHFEEYNPSLTPKYSHTTVERTKSDPNSLSNSSRLGLNARRHVLMHQKSIDLTPADSSDDDYIYKQIPSAPPMCKSHGNFEIPKCFGTNTNQGNVTNSVTLAHFKLNKSRLTNTTKDEISYVLHKRHIGSSSNSPQFDIKNTKPRSPKSPANTKTTIVKVLPTAEMMANLHHETEKPNEKFCITNKMDIKSPSLILKSDCLKQLDLSVIEKLNEKLSQIESDSATSSHTESLQHRKSRLERKELQLVHNLNYKLQASSAKTQKLRVISKSKLSKPKKSKTRITSFSSDDESIDSDDVFGSTEAISHNHDFSPPQSRKEIEPILKIEQNRLISAFWGRGQTMSSTEIEGSPPQCRRLVELENRYQTPKLDLPYLNNSELRRISERSLSIPSSEEEHNVVIRRNEICTNDYQMMENIPSPIFERKEFNRNTDEYDIDYKLTKKKLHSTSDVKHSKSKIIEDLIDSPFISRSKIQAPILFAHARLNLSEGSVILQRQMSTQHQTFSFDRRSKSLDAPVIALHKLPSMNAFSSKDDTVSFEEESEILEEKPLHISTTGTDDDPAESVKSCAGSIPTQEFSSMETKEKFTNTVILEKDEIELLKQIALIEKIALHSVKIKMKNKSKVRLRSGNRLILDIPKYGFNEWSPCISGGSSRKTSPVISRAGSYDNSANYAGTHFDLCKANNNRSRTRRTSADDIKDNESKKKKMEKNRARSNENQKFNRDKSKSQEETKADIKARKERQQKLYESAMKRTKTTLSPVLDNLPLFPTQTDKVSVKTEGNKIIIDTEFKSKVEDHVLIAKSPRRLDTSLIHFSRSFDESRCPDKLDKANRSFEDQNKSFEKSDKLGSRNLSDGLLKNQPANQNIKHKIEDAVVYKSNGKSKILEKSVNVLGTFNKLQSFTEKKKHETQKLESSKTVKRSSAADRKIFSHQFSTEKDVDMQAVISERRSLEIYKRSLTSEEAKDSELNTSRKPSTTESIDSYVSIDNSYSPVSKSPIPSHESYPYRVPTIECEEASIEETGNCNECHHLKVLRTDTNRLSLDRSKSDETGSWMTVECDEFVGSDTSDNDNPRTADPERFILESQTTLEDACPLEYSNCVTPTSDLGKMVTPPYASPLVDIPIPELFKTQNLRTESSVENNKSKESHSVAYIMRSHNLEDVREDFKSLVSIKEKSSIDDESSVSWSIARPLGISQEFGDREAKKCWEIKEKILKLELNTDVCLDENIEKRGRSFTKKQTTPVLEKQDQIDLDVHSDVNEDCSEDARNKTVKIFKNQVRQIREPITLFQPENCSKYIESKELQSNINFEPNSILNCRIAYDDKTNVYALGSQVNNSEQFSKPTENESSNGDILQNIESIDCDRCDTSSYILHEVGNTLSKPILSGFQKETDPFPEELNDFPTNIGYPALTCGIGINQSDIVGFSPTFTVGRTLSRISERSTASEKSSIEDDISKASTHSASLRDESVALTDHHPSLSSDSRSNTNLAYLSEADRRTSAEMPEIPCDSATGDKLSSIESNNDPKSPTVLKGRFSVTQIMESRSTGDKPSLLCLSNAGSQDSEDWPLPEIPFDNVPVKPVESFLSLPGLDKPLLKTFCCKSAIHLDSSLDDNVEEYSCTRHASIQDFQAGFGVEVDSFLEARYPGLANTANYENNSLFMPLVLESNEETLEAATCFNPSSCLLSSFNVSCTLLENKPSHKKETIDVILSQPTRSPTIKSLPLEHQHFSNEFVSNSHISSSLNASYEEINQSMSAVSVLDEHKKVKSNRTSAAPCRKCSHSSHSEEETSSIGTEVEGTVRMGYQQNKCTHSSHSEDTSIGLSISEWSGGTNTVKQYANLSGSDSISAPSYIKSEKSHATKSSMSSINKSLESLNDQSASCSNRFPMNNGGLSDGFRYEIFSNSETEKASDTTSATKSDDTTPTLTEIIHSFSERSTSSSRTIVGYTTSESHPTDNEQKFSLNESSGYETRRRKTQNTCKTALFEEKKEALAKIHKTKDSMYGISSDALRRKSFLKENEEYELVIQRSFVEDKNEKEHAIVQCQSKAAADKKAMPIKLNESINQDDSSYVERLYVPNEKLSERSQSQDLSTMKTIQGKQKRRTECQISDSTMKTAQSMSIENNLTEMIFPSLKDYTGEKTVHNNKQLQSFSNQEPIHLKSQEPSTFSNETIARSSFGQEEEILNKEIIKSSTDKTEKVSKTNDFYFRNSKKPRDNVTTKMKCLDYYPVPIKPARSKRSQ